MLVKIKGGTHHLWRAVDHEGQVLQAVVTKKRDMKAALKRLRKLLRRCGEPNTIVTDKLKSHQAALCEPGISSHETHGRWINNRAENSHLPLRRRERSMQRLRLKQSLQKFAAIHYSVHNHFNQERNPYSRSNFKQNRTAALAEWRQLIASWPLSSPTIRRLVRVRLTAPSGGHKES